MPHFIIECNTEVLEKVNGETLALNVFDTVLKLGLFSKSNIKVRVKNYDVSIIAGEKLPFIHVWGYIRSGRTNENKRILSENIVNKIDRLTDGIFVISMNIQELDQVSYYKIQNER